VIERLSLSKAADAISGAASGALFACRSWRSIGLPASSGISLTAGTIIACVTVPLKTLVPRSYLMRNTRNG
jgi:hypothetical protein